MKTGIVGDLIKRLRASTRQELITSSVLIQGPRDQGSCFIRVQLFCFWLAFAGVRRRTNKGDVRVVSDSDKHDFVVVGDWQNLVWGVSCSLVNPR